MSPFNPSIGPDQLNKSMEKMLEIEKQELNKKTQAVCDNISRKISTFELDANKENLLASLETEYVALASIADKKRKTEEGDYLPELREKIAPMFLCISMIIDEVGESFESNVLNLKEAIKNIDVSS